MKRLVALGIVVLACAGVTYAGEIDPGLGQVLRDSRPGEIVSTGRHNAGQSRHLKHVAFGNPFVANESQCFRTHGHSSTGPRLPQCDFFRTDVDHPARALLVKVGKLRHATDPIAAEGEERQHRNASAL